MNIDKLLEVLAAKPEPTRVFVNPFKDSLDDFEQFFYNFIIVCQFFNKSYKTDDKYNKAIFRQEVQRFDILNRLTFLTKFHFDKRKFEESFKTIRAVDKRYLKAPNYLESRINRLQAAADLFATYFPAIKGLEKQLSSLIIGAKGRDVNYPSHIDTMFKYFYDNLFDFKNKKNYSLLLVELNNIRSQLSTPGLKLTFGAVINSYDFKKDYTLDALNNSSFAERRFQELYQKKVIEPSKQFQEQQIKHVKEEEPIFYNSEGVRIRTTPIKETVKNIAALPENPIKASPIIKKELNEEVVKKPEIVIPVESKSPDPVKQMSFKESFEETLKSFVTAIRIMKTMDPKFAAELEKITKALYVSEKTETPKSINLTNLCRRVDELLTSYKNSAPTYMISIKIARALEKVKTGKSPRGRIPLSQELKTLLRSIKVEKNKLLELQDLNTEDSKTVKDYISKIDNTLNDPRYRVHSDFDPKFVKDAATGTVIAAVIFVFLSFIMILLQLKKKGEEI